MSNTDQVAFIMCLPRSGSTLLQRLLSSHSGIRTVPESWMLLHALYPIGNDEVYSVYSSFWAKKGMLDFLHQTPDGVEEYLKKVGELFIGILRHQFNGASGMFIEKTPRYSLIAEELITAFPEAKFIFLWRNPLAVKQSMNDTWSNGRWHFRCNIDLYVGLPKLIAARKLLGNRALAIRYEDIISEPENTVKSIQEFLNIPVQSLDLSKSDKKLESRIMGDKRGIQAYGQNIAVAPRAWSDGYRNWVRRAFARKYLNYIGDEALEIMGYNRRELLSEIHMSPRNFRFLISDILRILYSKLAEKTLFDVVARRIHTRGRHLLS